jgi:hypothetical protein
MPLTEHNLFLFNVQNLGDYNKYITIMNTFTNWVPVLEDINVKTGHTCGSYSTYYTTTTTPTPTPTLTPTPTPTPTRTTTSVVAHVPRISS